VRIALVSDWYRPRVGGIELHVEKLAVRLAALGHAVTVITPTPGDPADGSAGITVRRFPATLCPGIRLMCAPRGFFNLYRELKAGDFDVVHAHCSLAAPVGYSSMKMAVRLRLPGVLTVHSVWGNYRHLITAVDWLIRWSRWPVVFSAVSERSAHDMRRLGARPIRLLPNAVDASDWRVEPKPSDGTFSLACVMRLALRKRGRALVTLWPRVLAALPPAVPRPRLRIVGEGSQKEALIRLAGRLGVADSVEFLGRIDQPSVRRLFSESTAFVLPALLEAFGIAALEARVAGLPVVAMRDSGVSELIRHGQEGLLADNDDDLVAQLVRLVSEPGLCERLAAHNRTLPLEFTWERTLAAHLAAYAEARRLAGRAGA
jgi:glycosyltransferase involved in cell wall biosynthesis